MTYAVVTGGAGAIGSRLVARLTADGERVRVIDDLSTGYADNLSPEVDLVTACITDPTAVTKVVDGDVSCVFHLASSFANEYSVYNPESDLLANALGTLRLLEHALTQFRSGHLRRIVIASSSSVYEPSATPLTEESRVSPSTPYAVSKVAIEGYAGFYHRYYGLPVTTLRIFNSYGPGERPGRFRNVIPNFVSAALRGAPLVVTGRGEESRDFTYVDDVVDGFVRATQSAATLGRRYNIGTGRETSIGALAEKIVRLCGSPSEIHYVNRRSWDTAMRRCADVSKARADLSYRPRVEIGDGLLPTISALRCLEARGALAGGPARDVDRATRARLAAHVIRDAAVLSGEDHLVGAAAVTGVIARPLP